MEVHNGETVTLKFSLKKKSIPVVLETEVGEENFFLVELTGKERDAYLDAMSGRMKYDSKGNPVGLKSFSGLQASLLTLCLEDEKGEKVLTPALQKFPASVVNELFKRAQELNALDEAGQEEAKNE